MADRPNDLRQTNRWGWRLEDGVMEFWSQDVIDNQWYKVSGSSTGGSGSDPITSIDFFYFSYSADEPVDVWTKPGLVSTSVEDIPNGKVGYSSKDGTLITTPDWEDTSVAPNGFYLSKGIEIPNDSNGLLWIVEDDYNHQLPTGLVLPSFDIPNYDSWDGFSGTGPDYARADHSHPDGMPSWAQMRGEQGPIFEFDGDGTVMTVSVPDFILWTGRTLVETREVSTGRLVMNAHLDGSSIVCPTDDGVTYRVVGIGVWD